MGGETTCGPTSREKRLGAFEGLGVNSASAGIEISRLPFWKFTG
jgi:hypothetical protein